MKSERNIKFESENLKRRDPSKDRCRRQDSITCHRNMVWRYGLDLPQEWDQWQAVLKSHASSCTIKVNELCKLSGTHDWTMSNIPCKMDNHLIWVMSNRTLGNCHKSLQNYHVLFAKLYGVVNEQRYLNYIEIHQYITTVMCHSFVERWLTESKHWS